MSCFVVRGCQDGGAGPSRAVADGDVAQSHAVADGGVAQSHAVTGDDTDHSSLRAVEPAGRRRGRRRAEERPSRTFVLNFGAGRRGWYPYYRHTLCVRPRWPIPGLRRPFPGTHVELDLLQLQLNRTTASGWTPRLGRKAYVGDRPRGKLPTMMQRLQRFALFACYQTAIALGILMLPVALLASRAGVRLPVHRLVQRTGTAYANTR